MPDISASVVGGQTESAAMGLKERFVLNILARLNMDTGGRLRVAFDTASAMATVTTVSAVTNITNWGLQNVISKTQLETMSAYQGSYRRNLIQS